MFWLSHHHPEEYDRTFAFGGVRLCARCLGTYPVMFAAIAAQIAMRAPTTWAHDLTFGPGLLLPALVDWAHGRFRPHAFSNPWRLFTGALLGLSLGRSLYIHLREPLPPVLLWQAALVLVVALPVLAVTWRRKSG